MQGITILDTINIYEISWWQLLLGLLPLALGAVFYFVKWHRAFKKGTPDEQARGVVNTDNYSVKDFCRSVLTLIVGGIISVVLATCFAKFWPAKYVETHYEIAIADSASFNDVYSNYVIIEEKENTFVVKERSSYE